MVVVVALFVLVLLVAIPFLLMGWLAARAVVDGSAAEEGELMLVLDIETGELAAAEDPDDGKQGGFVYTLDGSLGQIQTGSGGELRSR